MANGRYYFSPMLKKRVYNLLLIALMVVPMFSWLHAQPGTWAISAGAGARDYVSDILVDNSGNTYITGYFSDSIEFENTKLMSLGKNDIYVAKYDPNGSLVWAQRHGWLENDFTRKLAMDWDGTILVVGDYQDSTILAGDTILSLDTLWFGPYAETYDVFILEVEPDGSTPSVFADGWFSSERCYDLEVDGNADRIMGVTWHTWSWWEKGTPGKGFHDAMIVALDSEATMTAPNVNLFFHNRTHAWGKQFDEAREVEVIGDSLYVLGGMFQDTCYFRDSTLFGVTDFEDDIFITTHDDTAGFKWAIWGGSAGKDRMTGMVHDAMGNLYVTGTYIDTFSMGGQSIVSAGNLDGFIAKIDQNGNLVWLTSVGGENYDALEAIAIRPSGDLVITGYFQGELTLGGTTLQAIDSLDQNVLVASVETSNGAVNWAWGGGGDGIDIGQALSISSSNEIYVVGSYTGTAVFGQQQLPSNGSDDIFILRMDATGSVSRPEADLSGIDGLNIYPNPSYDRVNISFELQRKELVEASLLDLGGKVVLNRNFGQMIPGSHNFAMDLAGLAPGFYLMQLKAGEQSKTRKLVIAK